MDSCSSFRRWSHLYLLSARDIFPRMWEMTVIRDGTLDEEIPCSGVKEAGTGKRPSAISPRMEGRSRPASEVSLAIPAGSRNMGTPYRVGIRAEPQGPRRGMVHHIADGATPAGNIAATDDPPRLGNQSYQPIGVCTSLSIPHPVLSINGPG